MRHAQKAYEYAIAQDLTPQQVAAASYSVVAVACGVAIGPNGESPKTFFYRSIRQRVAARLRREAGTEKAEARRIVMRDQMKKAASMLDVTVTRIGPGETATGPGYLVMEGSENGV
jgi:hypothetical protein